jgi:translocation and assembly module TamB
MTTKKFLKKTGKLALYLLGILIIIVIGALIFINTQSGKNFIKNKIQSYLQTKIKTTVVITSLDYSLPKWIELKGVYLEDRHKDTLLFGEQLSVDLNMLKLISGNIFIRKISAKNLYANISRPENDTAFNYQFILDAFSDTTKKTTATADTTALKITLQQLLLNNIRLKFTDKYGGNQFTAGIKNAGVIFNRFQPDRMQFGINDFTASGIDFFMAVLKESTVSKTIDTTAVNLLFKANQIDLKAVNVVYQNKVNGMYYANVLPHIGISKIDIDLARENAFLGNIFSDSSFIQFTAPKTTSKPISPDTAASSNWKITINTLQINNNTVVYDDNNVIPSPGFDYNHIGLKNIQVNTGKIYYAADSILASISQLAFKDKSGFLIDTTHADIRYTSKGIEVNQLFIKTPQSVIQHTLVLKYDDIKRITAAPQNSTVNVQLKNTIVAVNDVYMLMPSAKKYMPEKTFKNKFIRLSTAINGNLQQLNIPSLQLAGLDGTAINAKAVLYNVTDTINLGYDITLFNSSLPKADLLKFLPPTNELMNKLPPVVNFSTHLKGNLRNAIVENISISSNSFSLAGKAEIKHFDNPAALQYNIAITGSRVEKSFIMALVPPGTIPASINLPDVMMLTGTASGDMNSVQPNLTLRGSYGEAKLKGFVRQFKDPEKAVYDLAFSTKDFKAGKLIQQDTVIGNLSFTGYAKGKGFNYKTMAAEIRGQVESVGYNKYDYKNILLNASLNKGDITSNGSIDDPNIRLHYTATANVKGAYPSAETNLVVDTIQLQPLHFYKDTLSASFRALIKAPGTDPENMDVFAAIDSARINVKNKLYSLDSIIAKAKTTNGINTITLTSPLADITATGKFQYDKIGPSLLQYADQYYNITDSVKNNLPQQQINFEGVIKKHPLVKSLADGFDYADIVFKGGYKSDDSDSALQLKVTIPYLLYQTNKISNGTVDIASLNDKITSAVNFDTLHFGSNILYKTNITADVAGNSLSVTAATKDVKGKDRFALGAGITQKDSAYSFSLKDTLVLDYKNWTVAADNKITYSNAGILVNNFLLTGNNSKIEIKSRENVLNSPVDVTIEQFHIKDISSMLNSDTLLADGTINGKFSVSEFDKKLPAFTGTLQADSLQLMQQQVGNIKLFTKKLDENTITTTIGLTGSGNKAAIKGNYYLNTDAKQFDADINIANLNMATLQAFSQGQLTQSSGSIKGKVTVNGKFAAPEWHGSIGFDTARFTIAQLGTPYLISNQNIVLQYPAVAFNNFTIKDSANNAMAIDGKVTSKSIADYDFDLNINAKNFTVVNVKKAIASQVYGFAAMDAAISVKGSAAAPAIEGNLSLNDKTDVTLVLSESNVNKDAAKSVVQFIDRDTFLLPEKKPVFAAADSGAAMAKFLNYNLNLEVSKKAALTIVIDPGTGDELKIKGDAQLNAGVDPGGNIILAGTYELSSGYYILNYQFLKKQFNLQPVSTITFTGDPAKAQIDITAAYIAKTAPKDLVGNEIGSVDPKLANSFKQDFPFTVLLHLKGSMLKPEISFDIVLPETVQMNSDLRSTIDTKLTQLRADDAATNKQVFSLLLFNRFIGEQSSDFFNSGGSGGGSNFTDIARQSVSKFLSSALDNIAGDLFKGLDVDLNLNSYKDYSSGDAQQKTDLNIAVSKSFINDRLSITVGQNFGIEGQDASARSARQKGAGFLPDVTLNYKLSQDGKYLLRAYKKTQFEVVLDGYVIENGLAFIVTMDVDKFSDLFRKKSKKATP